VGGAWGGRGDGRDNQTQDRRQGDRYILSEMDFTAGIVFFLMYCS